MIRRTQSLLPLRTSSYCLRLTFFLCCLALFSAVPGPANGQGLEELMHSEAYQNFNVDKPVKKSADKKDKAPPKVLTNYDSLWTSKQQAKLLVEWSDARIPNHRLGVFAATLSNECVQVLATLRNRDRIDVSLAIQVPRPTYRNMAELKTLASFNRFRPPALKVVASQKIEVQGIQADYYRHQEGACSLLIPIAQQGIINLSVPSCTQSTAMFEAAKLLNISRLNSKLTS